LENGEKDYRPPGPGLQQCAPNERRTSNQMWGRDHVSRKERVEGPKANQRPTKDYNPTPKSSKKNKRRGEGKREESRGPRMSAARVKLSGRFFPRKNFGMGGGGGQKEDKLNNVRRSWGQRRHKKKNTIAMGGSVGPPGALKHVVA